MNLSKISSTVGSPEVARGRISGGSTTGSPYILSSEGVTRGLWLPRWHVQQVTIWRPLKLSRLMAATIRTIRRAVRFLGGSSSHLGLEVPAPV
jgi:hypothetical protein